VCVCVCVCLGEMEASAVFSAVSSLAFASGQEKNLLRN